MQVAKERRTPHCRLPVGQQRWVYQRRGQALSGHLTRCDAFRACMRLFPLCDSHSFDDTGSHQVASPSRRGIS